jgi:hypothetical protein
LTERVRARLQTTRPTAEAQKSQTTRARFFISIRLLLGPRLLLTGCWMRAGAIALIEEDTTAEAGERLHFRYGLGSLRSCAWNGGPCGCEDVGNCCRCGNFAESFGPGGSEWRWDGSGEGCGAKTDPRGGTTGGSGRQDDGAGASEQRGFGSRGQAVWGDRMGELYEAVGCSVAGVYGCLLWNLCAVCCNGGLEAAGESA